MVIKVIAVIATLLATSIAPANARMTPVTPDLRGWICVDTRGVHHSWKAAFDGVTYCKLIKNPALMKQQGASNG